MQIHVWDTRIIIKNTLVSPGTYVKGYASFNNEGYKDSKQLFHRLNPLSAAGLTSKGFHCHFKWVTHKDLVILHLNYSNGPFSAPAELHPFRYFPKEHFLLYCFVHFPSTFLSQQSNHTHQHSHSFIKRVGSQAGGEPSIILSLILQQDFPGEVSFTIKWFNLQKEAIPLPCNSGTSFLFSPCICFCAQSDLTVSWFGNHKSLQKSHFSSSLAS